MIQFVESRREFGVGFRFAAVVRSNRLVVSGVFTILVDSFKRDVIFPSAQDLLYRRAVSLQQQRVPRVPAAAPRVPIGNVSKIPI